MKALKKSLADDIKYSFGLMVCVVFAFLAGYKVHGAMLDKNIETIPTLTEIQEMVGAVPDGVYGKQTKKLWDRAICDKLAVEMLERQGY